MIGVAIPLMGRHNWEHYQWCVFMDRLLSWQLDYEMQETCKFVLLPQVPTLFQTVMFGSLPHPGWLDWSKRHLIYFPVIDSRVDMSSNCGPWHRKLLRNVSWFPRVIEEDTFSSSTESHQIWGGHLEKSIPYFHSQTQDEDQSLTLVMAGPGVYLSLPPR